MPQLTSLLRRVAYLALVAGCAAAGHTQQAPGPTVSFTFDFPASEPSHYALSVTSDRRGHYESTGKLSPQADSAEVFRLDFDLPANLVRQIFDLSKRARYFQGDLDAKKPNLAFTGAKTLAYQDGARTSQATYNYSTIPAVQELTATFQKMSTTLEFGHRIEYYARYQKLALAEELKRMEELADKNDLEALSAVAPILQKIADDKSVIRVVRARALRLVARTSTPGTQ